MKKTAPQPHLSLERISLETTTQRRSFVFLSEFLVLLFLSLGILFTLHLTLSCPLNLLTVGGAVLFPLWITLLFHLPRFRWAVLLFLFLLVGGAVWIYRQELLTACEFLRLEFTQDLNAYFGTGFSLPAVYLTSREVDTLVSPLVLILLFVFLALAGYALIREKSVLSILLLEIPFLWLAVNMGDMPAALPLVLLMLSLGGALSMRGAVRLPRRRETDGEFSVSHRKRKKVYRQVNPELQQESIAKNGLGMILLLAVLFAFITAVFPREAYHRSPILQEMDQNPIAFFQEHTLLDLFRIQAHGGIGGGALGNVDEVSYSGEPAFRLSGISEEMVLYLKGYVGSRYMGNRWAGLEESVYRENAAVFDAFTRAGENVQLFSSAFANSLREGNYVQRENFSITPLSLPKQYLLTPYGFSGNENIPSSNYRRDTDISGWNVPDTYRVDAVFWRDDASGSYRQTLSGVHENSGGSSGYWKQFYYSGLDSLQQSRIDGYVRFVQEYDTALPENGLSRLRAEYGSPEVRALSLKELTARIKGDLSANAAYDLAPGRTPPGKDFAEYFLYENRRGYCVHFATAATLMFRAAGVPARYVEGYIVTESDYASMQDHTVTITDRNAHAWTEIYVEPFGWIPVEVTPGFTGEAIADPDDFVVSSRPESEEEVFSEPVSSQPAESSGELPAEDTAASAPVSSSPAGTSGGNGPSPSQGGIRWEALLRPLLWGGGILLLLLAALLLLLQREKQRREKRRKQFAQADTRQAALEIYRYCLEILRYRKIVPMFNEPAPDFARRVETLLPESYPKDMAFAAGRAQAARFGDSAISQEDLQRMRRFAAGLSRSVYSELSAPQKLLYRYWLVL